MKRLKVTTGIKKKEEMGRCRKRRPRGDTESVHFQYKVFSPETKIKRTTEVSPSEKSGQRTPSHSRKY